MSQPTTPKTTNTAGSNRNASTPNLSLATTAANAPSTTHIPTARSTTSSTPNDNEKPILMATYRPPMRIPPTSACTSSVTGSSRQSSQDWSERIQVVGL